MVTNETVCRQNSRETILRLADDVGIELTPECLRDFNKEGTGKTAFEFTATDIAQLKPRVKFLNILDKADGMALAGELESESKSVDTATKSRLVYQAVSKLRTAMGGVFPDLEVAMRLAAVRCKHIQFETEVEVVKNTVLKSFEELDVIRWGVEADEKRMELAIELAHVALGNKYLIDREVRHDVVKTAFKTLSPKDERGYLIFSHLFPPTAFEGQEQDEEADEKWVNRSIELAHLVQSDGVLSKLDMYNLLELCLGGIKSVDETKQRVVTEIIAKATRAKAAEAVELEAEALRLEAAEAAEAVKAKAAAHSGE